MEDCFCCGRQLDEDEAIKVPIRCISASTYEPIKDRDKDVYLCIDCYSDFDND